MAKRRDLEEEMLADFARMSGIPIGELGGPPQPPELPEGFEAGPLGGELEQSLNMAEPLDLENDSGRDFDDYLDDFYEDIDVDPDDDDPYSDEPV